MFSFFSSMFSFFNSPFSSTQTLRVPSQSRDFSGISAAVNRNRDTSFGYEFAGLHYRLVLALLEKMEEKNKNKFYLEIDSAVGIALLKIETELMLQYNDGLEIIKFYATCIALPKFSSLVEYLENGREYTRDIFVKNLTKLFQSVPLKIDEFVYPDVPLEFICPITKVMIVGMPFYDATQTKGEAAARFDSFIIDKLSIDPNSNQRIHPLTRKPFGKIAHDHHLKDRIVEFKDNYRVLGVNSLDLAALALGID